MMRSSTKQKRKSLSSCSHVEMSMNIIEFAVNLLAVINAETLALSFCSGGDDKTNDQSVQAERFRKDKNKDHANEQSWLLSIRTNASVSDNTNGEPSRQGTHAHGQSSA